MRAVWAVLAALPPLARWGILGLGGCLVVLLLSSAVVAILQQREAAAVRALAAITPDYRQAMAPNGSEAQLDEAASALRQFLRDHPRSDVAAHAWYDLGNVEYARGAYDAAMDAFAEARRRDGGTIGDLSGLGIAYAREAQQEPAAALEAYREALTGRRPTDFLYGELLLGMARAHEELDQPGEAREAYQRFLRDVPDSPQSAEVRSRLALLGGGSEPAQSQ